MDTLLNSRHVPQEYCELQSLDPDIFAVSEGPATAARFVKWMHDGAPGGTWKGKDEKWIMVSYTMPGSDLLSIRSGKCERGNPVGVNLVGFLISFPSSACRVSQPGSSSTACWRTTIGLRKFRILRPLQRALSCARTQCTELCMTV